MNGIKDCRDEGYQQGFKDGQRTSGKENKKYTATLFAQKAQNLSKNNSIEYIAGWHAGFADGMTEIIRKMVHQEGLATKYFKDLYYNTDEGRS